MRGLGWGICVAWLLRLAGCSFWVSSEPEQIGCVAEGKVGPPACDVGYICARQSCVLCIARELCGDGVDNDCNGAVDEQCSAAGTGGATGGSGAAFSGSGAAFSSAGEEAKPATSGAHD